MINSLGSESKGKRQMRKGIVALAIIASAAVLGWLMVPSQSILAQTPGPVTLAACPSGVTLTVQPPTSSAPTVVSVQLSQTLNIKPASASDPTSLHLHYFIDTQPTAAGQTVPSGDPKIIHSGSTTQDLGTLSAGEHTVWVVVGQLNHTACEVRGSATFTTVATAAPKTGDAGLAAPTNSSWPSSYLEAGIVIAVLGATGLAAVGLTLRHRRWGKSA